MLKPTGCAHSDPLCKSNPVRNMEMIRFKIGTAMLLKKKVTEIGNR